MTPENPFEPSRSRLSAEWTSPGWQVIVCTVYVCLPALFGMLSTIGLTFGDAGDGQRGLVGGAVFGGLIGFPLAFIQLLAVVLRSIVSARTIVLLFALFSLLLVIGLAFNLAAVLGLVHRRDYLDSLASWVFALLLVAANLYTYRTMRHYAFSLGDQ